MIIWENLICGITHHLCKVQTPIFVGFIWKEDLMFEATAGIIFNFVGTVSFYWTMIYQVLTKQTAVGMLFGSRWIMTGFGQWGRDSCTEVLHYPVSLRWLSTMGDERQTGDGAQPRWLMARCGSAWSWWKEQGRRTDEVAKPDFCSKFT
jgi:hypothetical protein